MGKLALVIVSMLLTLNIYADEITCNAAENEFNLESVRLITITEDVSEVVTIYKGNLVRSQICVSDEVSGISGIRCGARRGYFDFYSFEEAGVLFVGTFQDVLIPVADLDCEY